MLPQIINAYGVDAAAVSIPTWLDLTGVIVGSLAGMLTAQDRKLDLVGSVGLSLVCGLGGGLIRDVILGVGNVYMMQSPYAIPASVATGIVGFFFPSLLKRFPSLLAWMDILAVGLFSLLGTDKAIVYNMWPASCLLLGTITGVGGGMLRDIFLGEVPHIFKRSNLYAVCALAGAAAYYLCVICIHLKKPWAAVVSMLVCVGLRRASLHFNIMTPADIDLTPRVTDGIHRLRKK